MQPDAVLAILGMAAVTFAIRAAGYLVADRLPSSGFIAVWLRHIPGAVLASLVAPAVLAGELPEWMASLATAVAFLLTRSLLLAMVTGVACVFVARLALGG